MSDYSKLPAAATLAVRPFTARAPEEKVQHFQQLLALSPIGPAVFENTHNGRAYGITRDWLQDAKEAWLRNFDWRRCEARINSFPNFQATVEDTDGNTLDVHFMGLFSERADAIPIAFLHGWPSSCISFMDILDLLREKYTARDLPYHVIVPSLPGYAYSSGPPMDKEFGLVQAAGVVDSLMIGLGFKDGYLVQGGDLGSFLSRILALTSDSCKGMHVNMMTIPGGQEPGDDLEKAALEKAKEAVDTGMAFALEQGTRPATIGLALSASPLALLSWIGEKMLAWTDQDPPLEKILETATLYWMTDTISRSFWHNRAMAGDGEEPKMARLSVLICRTELNVWIAAEFDWQPHGQQVFSRMVDAAKHDSSPVNLQAKVDMTLTQRRIPKIGNADMSKYNINESLLVQAAFEPKTYTMTLEKGTFLSPCDAQFPEYLTEHTPRFQLRLTFDTSPYPPRCEWQKPQEGPDAIRFWEWKQFCGRNHV
ncbi:epoxide hydrolase [Cordyceps militaris CM01]|uniref:Epoxide hydrolase n=1 Tax=Cordyceps militaris (strain CM01) TaxID=983644 RepID=G3JIG4_CORMM|nr:epoxide hydrolase [Cordyceps militaris CM01]EGX91065.1 epoxide hydrolase [Cordyceps militaris CM01]